MSEFTLHDLQCFDAVVREGGFQAAAETLHRSHPAVFAAVAKLERQLDLQLLDRGGYRVKPTPAGQSFHRRAQALLRELAGLRAHAEQLSMGQESELNVVIGDFCPRPLLLGLLGKFFAQWPATRLNLHFEAVTGPWERLLQGDADLILHRVEAGDARVEWLGLGKVPFVPVAAPGYLAPARRAMRPEDLRDYTQCVMRDTARHAPARDFFMIEGARQCTVADQVMKKEIILQGLAWGHMPRFLVEDELRDGRLLSLANRYLPGSVEALAAGRRADRPQGPVMTGLWDMLRAHAPNIRQAVSPEKKRKP
ncbi:LysR family transcriptional regulator [Achromobacter xylosoxidans]|uniref:LysR family transcriptional regulator n=1 Tax=Alcaligenes xylosoxydans xylosoxydans TaxID=85698 RepID=UPI0029274667|nr:LysR family transcriptional regulator [Achromobacter xylosoxidans]BEG77317.1 HTH-type transcriptional regulator YhaJ [Achromobacter xylosoxidans]